MMDALNGFECGEAAETNQEQFGEKKRRNRAVFVTTLRGLLQECDSGLKSNIRFG
jgi:hypothetical protein